MSDEIRPTELPTGWTLVYTDRYNTPYYTRSDGAYVWKSRDQYYSNPLDPKCRMWQAFLPDGTENGEPISKVRRNVLYRIPRKWQSPLAAICAVDLEFPVPSDQPPTGAVPPGSPPLP